jgi:ketosteroid isomerase-like protein
MDEQRKLSLVAEIAEAWNAGDHDLLLATLADDAVLRSLRSQLEGRSYRGPDGLREALVEWEEEWEYVRFERGEETANGDFVLADVRVQSRAKASGIELDVPMVLLYEFRGDEIVRIQSYGERAEAEREAGI